MKKEYNLQKLKKNLLKTSQENPLYPYLDLEMKYT